LIRADRRVALNERHGARRDGQLLGDELRLRGQHALTEIALARVGRHLAVGGNSDP
jgi:hypothetical protein